MVQSLYNKEMLKQHYLEIQDSENRVPLWELNNSVINSPPRMPSESEDSDIYNNS